MRPHHICWARDDQALPFFARDMEVCEIVLGFFPRNAEGKIDPTPDQHETAWQHVRCCFTCLRNVARVLFEYADGKMPLPLFFKREDMPDIVDVPPLPGVEKAKAN